MGRVGGARAVCLLGLDVIEVGGLEDGGCELCIYEWKTEVMKASWLLGGERRLRIDLMKRETDIYGFLTNLEHRKPGAGGGVEASNIRFILKRLQLVQMRESLVGSAQQLLKV